MRNHHIKVYRIDGAFAHQFYSLLELLEIKTVIFTDLDLRRKEKDEKGKKIDILSYNINDLNIQYANSTECLTTNGTLQYFIKKELNDEKAKHDKINTKLIEMLSDKDELVIISKNISMYSQGKINGYYATSFEEAIVLTNSINEAGKKYKKSLVKLLKKVHPKMKYFVEINENSELANKSYMYQVKLSDGKSKFSTGIVYLSVTDEDFSLKQPRYIESGLNSLSDYFKE